MTIILGKPSVEQSQGESHRLIPELLVKVSNPAWSYISFIEEANTTLRTSMARGVLRHIECVNQTLPTEDMVVVHSANDLVTGQVPFFFADQTSLGGG